LLQICLQTIAIVILLILVFRQRSSSNESGFATLRDLVLRLDAKTDRTEQALRSGIQELRAETISQIDRFSKTLECFTANGNEHQTALREALNTKLLTLQRDTAEILKGMQRQLSEQGSQIRDTVTGTLTNLGVELRENTTQFTNEVKGRLDDVSKHVKMLSDANEKKQDALRQTVEQRMDKLSENNSKKLEEMRQTVDEKLHSTLEKRLTESFGLVTDQLGKVQVGLGEMKDLAIGVGDLKRVLTNVKVRGGFAEVQLGMQLEQMLAPDQYVTNARIRPDSQETVEYAIRLPHGDNGQLLLPIDAKFPKEDWERLEDAQQRGNGEEIETAARNFEAGIRSEARKISEKYICPPMTTNFAIMFLPTEGLFAEVIRRPGLIDDLQTRLRICVCGPTTFMALLTSLQMGFKTLALQKKGSEVWNVLAATKIEFEKFGGLMTRVEKQVQTVQNTLGHISGKTKTINRTLKTVDTLEMPASVSLGLLGLDETPEEITVLDADVA
jgi:DNA recombination protein RmuC